MRMLVVRKLGTEEFLCLISELVLSFRHELVITGRELWPKGTQADVHSGGTSSLE